MTGSGCCRRSREYARERLEAAGEAGEIALRHAHRYAEVAREIRDGDRGRRTDRRRSSAGSPRRATSRPRSTRSWRAARAGDASALETGLQLCGDLCMYWHIRGKNLTAREYAASFSPPMPAARPQSGRAGALLTAGLGVVDARRVRAGQRRMGRGVSHRSGARCRARALPGRVLQGSRAARRPTRGRPRAARGSIERSRAIGFAWAEAFASTFNGMLQGVAGDVVRRRRGIPHALEIQQRLGDKEGAGLSLGGLAELAAAVAATSRSRSTSTDSRSPRSRRSVTGPRKPGSSPRWPGRTSARRHRARAPATSSSRYRPTPTWRASAASGCRLIGLAAIEAVERRPETRRADRGRGRGLCHQEGIVNVYSDEKPGREFVDRARAALSADDVARATDAGRRLTIKEALDLARTPEAAPV